VLIAEQLAALLRFTGREKALRVRVSILLTIGERESFGGPNVILSRRYLTPHLR
jgi:hypothetical protein